MLSVYTTTDLIPAINTIIQTEDRLEELVTVLDKKDFDISKSQLQFIVDENGIQQTLDWQNTTPPYLLPKNIELTNSNLLGLIFYYLGNTEKAWNYLNENPALQNELSLMSRLQYGYEIKHAELLNQDDSDFNTYRAAHNKAVIQQYGFMDTPPEFTPITDDYERAIATATDETYQAFTSKHFATFLIDAGAVDRATTILEAIKNKDIPEVAAYDIKYAMTNIWMNQLTVPYDEKLLSELKETLWEVLQYYEASERHAEVGLLLLDAAHIANISESFSESLGYVTRAIKIFEAEQLTELAANAHLRKGTLLYTWAQNGNPQFFKPSIESYQEALKTFTKEAAPDIFADVHHHLGVLYTDMPKDMAKAGIWAGVAFSSFNEALEFYNKTDYPYQYGMISNNFGNAFTKFPQAVLTDNYEKSLFYYQEALDVRTPDYPYERAITLLNYLEASWEVGNNPETFNQERYDDMLKKAEEIKTLVDDKEMLEEADRHLALLAQLKQSV